MMLKIQILIDNKDSWIVPYAYKFVFKLKELGYNSKLIFEHDDVLEGDILCLLGCEKKFKFLRRNKFNLVVHESNLPLGRGMSPFTWQILEGKNEIPITLLEATDEIDAGFIYEKTTINLEGTELVDEWRMLQAEATFKLIENFVLKFPEICGFEQKGVPTYYSKRTFNDSKMDIQKSIIDQFNLLRVVDNERYPAWFEFKGQKFKLIIEKMER